MRTIQTIVTILALTATASVFAEAQGMLLESDSSYPATSVPALPEHKRVTAQLRDSATHGAGDSIYAGA